MAQSLSISRMVRSDGFNSGWITALAITLFVSLTVTLTPFMPEGVRHIVMASFSSVCHQLPGRSAHINGVQLGVCHRCLGIYWGLPVAALVFGFSRGFWPIKRNSGFWILALSAVPALMDWSGDIVGFWTNTPVSRMITGSIFGLTAGYFFTLALVDVFQERSKKTEHS